MSDETLPIDNVLDDVIVAVWDALAAYQALHPESVAEVSMYPRGVPVFALVMPDGSHWKLRIEAMPVYTLA